MILYKILCMFSYIRVQVENPYTYNFILIANLHTGNELFQLVVLSNHACMGIQTLRLGLIEQLSNGSVAYAHGIYNVNQ